MRIVYPLLVVLPFLVGVSNVSSQEKDKDRQKLPIPTRAEVMAAKLKQSQLLLEGIAIKDFNKIGDSADEIVRISRAADFLNAHKGEEYQYQVVLFRRSVEQIARKAKEKNLDGVVLGYMDMTVSCVKCHQHTRDLANMQ